MTDTKATLLDRWLSGFPSRAIACSGGVDSMLLATIAHRHDPAGTLIVHDVTPAVPPAATARVVQHAEHEGWRLRLIRSAEFEDERYLSNPRDRCYLCKSHLYDTMADVVAEVAAGSGVVLLSGANLDDLGEYRPGLRAADEHAVRHPYVEVGLGKADIRSLATSLALNFADLPASPCLASRLYTGTRVTPTLLRAVDVGEELLRSRTGIAVVRCRLEQTVIRVEVLAADRPKVTGAVLDAVLATMRSIAPILTGIVLDADDYRAWPGLHADADIACATSRIEFSVSERAVDLGFARVDIDRRERTGDPEVVYAAGKTPQDTVAIAAALREAHPDHPTLITRATPAHVEALQARWPEVIVEHGTVVIGALREPCGRVVIVSAGTSDASVVAEAKLTVAVFGSEPLVVNDVGVAGLHRVLAIRPTLEEADAIIVVAGMEGALPSVVGGLVGTPVIAVPTSVGYGANFGGLSALLGMLNSCAPGVVVCNIDNGFGAGVFAARVARAAARPRSRGVAQ